MHQNNSSRFFKNLCVRLKALLDDESGQNITEYGAIIAFVGVMIAMAFGLARGQLFGSICQAYSGVTSQMGALNAYSAST